MTPSTRLVSLVVPVYCEQEVLGEFYRRTKAVLVALPADLAHEIVFVNDGSTDGSLAILRGFAERDPSVRIIDLSRNFGHQKAITAGIDHAAGDAVVVIDADLQDPPEVVLEMVAKWREGYDVVYGKRGKREGETWFKLLTARWFYRIFAAMIPIQVPLDTGDFRLMSRRVVVALRALRETHRFVRGMVAWVGFKQTAVVYDRPGRVAGETKYPLHKMLKFAIDGITSFSVLPLRFATYLGMLISMMSVCVAIYALIARFILRVTVPGWTFETVLISLLAAVQLLMIGILGEYIGRIYEEVKRRPLYVVGDKVNLGKRDDDELDDDELDSPPTDPT
jgi:dolichol-phosphate mannosyltransferase